MKLVWTKRGIKRLQSAFDYIADNFYIDYALHFNMVGEGQHYVFLDEVQVVPDFERFIDGLFARKDCDVYITGSNSKALLFCLSEPVSSRI